MFFSDHLPTHKCNLLKLPKAYGSHKMIKQDTWKFGPRAEVYWAEVVLGAEVYPGRSRPQPKYAWGQSGLGVKLGVSQFFGF